MRHFAETLKIKVDKESKMVTLSVRTSDYKVEVHRLHLADFEALVADFQAQMRSRKK